MVDEKFHISNMMTQILEILQDLEDYPTNNFHVKLNMKIDSKVGEVAQEKYDSAFSLQDDVAREVRDSMKSILLARLGQLELQYVTMMKKDK